MPGCTFALRDDRLSAPAAPRRCELPHKKQTLSAAAAETLLSPRRFATWINVPVGDSLVCDHAGAALGSQRKWRYVPRARAPRISTQHRKQFMKISIAVENFVGRGVPGVAARRLRRVERTDRRRDLRAGRDRARRFLGRDSEDSVSARRHRLELHDRRAHRRRRPSISSPSRRRLLNWATARRLPVPAATCRAASRPRPS